MAADFTLSVSSTVKPRYMAPRYMAEPRYMAGDNMVQISSLLCMTIIEGTYMAGRSLANPVIWRVRPLAIMDCKRKGRNVVV